MKEKQREREIEKGNSSGKRKRELEQSKEEEGSKKKLKKGERLILRNEVKAMKKACKQWVWSVGARVQMSTRSW